MSGMPKDETPVAKLTRGRGGGWLVENYSFPDGKGEITFNAAASLQEARAVAKVVAYEDGWPGSPRWRADQGVHHLVTPA